MALRSVLAVRPSVLAPLRDPNVRRLVLGGAISAYGDALQNAAQGWTVVQLTHSARGVGLFAMAWLLPRVLSSMVAGVMVDRHRRSTVLKAAVVCGTAIATLFFVCALFDLLSFHVLLVLAFGFALTVPFEITSRNAMLPTFGDRDQIPAIVALNFFVMYAAELLGLISGGLLLASVGVIGCIALNLVTFVAYLLLVAPLRTPVVARGGTPLHRAFLDGVRFVASKSKASVPLLVGALFAFVGFHFDRSTLSLFAVENLHASARTYGFLLAASPLGAVLFLGLSRTRAPHEMPVRIVSSAMVLAVGLGLLALTARPELAFAILFCIGAARGLHYNAIATLLQMKVPDVFRGRVFSFYNVSGGLFGLGGMVMSGLAPVVGVAISSHARGMQSLGDALGLRGALLVASFATVICALLVTRPLRRIAEHDRYLYTEELAQLRPTDSHRSLPRL